MRLCFGDNKKNEKKSIFLINKKQFNAKLDEYKISHKIADNKSFDIVPNNIDSVLRCDISYN